MNYAGQAVLLRPFFFPPDRMPTSPEPHVPAVGGYRRSLAAGLVTLAVAALVCAFYAWTASSNGNDFAFKGRLHDYYNHLMHGFAKGHLYMDVEPGPVPVPDPTGLGGMPYLNDGTFYQGKYYLYFGPTPVLTVFLPYYLLTGGDISDNFVATLFVCAGYLLSLGLLWSVRNRHFPRSSPWLQPLCAVLLGLGSGCAIMLRHPMFYEAAIGCAYFFQTLMLFSLYRALHASAGRSRLGWLTLASLAAGLSVGARANLAFGTLVLLLVLVWLWRRREDRGTLLPAEVRGMALAGLGPIAACAAGLMAYNYLRFGSVLEFGVSYQFALVKPAFSLRFLPHNLKLYFFSFPEFSWYFPFITPVREMFRPEGYGGIEQMHGQFWSLIWLVPVFAVAVWLWRRRLGVGTPLGVFFTCGLWMYLVNLVILLCLGVRASRYIVDFQPTFLFLGAIGLMAGEQRFPWARWWRRLVRPVAVLAVVILGLHNIMASCQLYELFKYGNRRGYESIATAANRISDWAGPWLYGRQGPIRMRVSFPGGLGGQLEPLVVTGASEYNDFLLVHYLDEGTVRFVFMHYGYGQLVSQPVKVGVGVSHQLEIDLGSLYPPLAHPFFEGFARGERVQIKRTVRVAVDGEDVFVARSNFYDASPGALLLGENPISPTYGRAHFSGQITGVERGGLATMKARKASENFGPVALQVLLPQDMAQHGPEPLVVTGAEGQGDVVYIKYEGDRQVRFGTDHWGAGGQLSDPIEIDPTVPHDFEIWMGSLFPPAGSERLAAFPVFQAEQMKKFVRVIVDGREVFRAAVPFYDTSSETVDIGSNNIGLSTCGESFRGEIRRYGRAVVKPAIGVAELVPSGAVRMNVRFPAGRSGRSEPLLTTGVKGAGDVIFVTYLDTGHVRFSLDHWAAPLQQSLPVPVDLASVHGLEIISAALAGDGRTQAVEEGEFRVMLDGAVVFQGRSPFYFSPASEPAAGTNSIGATTSALSFGGVMTDIRWSRNWDGIADASRDYGPIRFQLTLPLHPSGQPEPLVVTGRTGAGDALVVTEADAGHIRLIWDHWQGGATSSAPILFERGRPHLVEVDMGSLYPTDSEVMARTLGADELARLRRTLKVRVDGVEVFAAEGDFHPVMRKEIQVGANQIGISSAVPLISSTVEAVQRPGVFR